MKNLKSFALSVSLMLVFSMVFTVFAQEEGTELTLSGVIAFVGDEIVITVDVDEDGEVSDEEFADGQEVIIAPAGSFNPSDYEDGDEITLVGILLESGTFMATGVVEEEAEPEVTPEPEATAEPEVTPEPEATTEPEEVSTCRETHPVAEALAEEYGVSVSEIMATHCAGVGFGIIARELGDGESLGTVMGNAPTTAEREAIRAEREAEREARREARAIARAEHSANNNGGGNGNGSGGNGNGNSNGRGNGNGNGGNGNGNGGNGNGNGGNGNGNGRGK